MRTASPTSEAVLTRAKAKRLSNGQLADEIRRCLAGLQSAPTPSAVGRWERRLHIMQGEADFRMAGGGR